MIQSSSIIKFKEHYLIHSQSRTINGPWVASDPFIKLPLNVDESTFVKNLKIALNSSKQNFPRPNDWTDFNKDYLRKMGLKYSKDLYNGTKLCDIEKSGDTIDITPMKNLGKKGGFDFLAPFKIKLPGTASDGELFVKIQEAFAKCE